MAREVGEYRIAVNCIAPGLTVSDAAKQGSKPAVLAQAVERRSFKREQFPEDLVGPVLFLASDESAFMSGQTIVIDGGTIMS